MAVPDVPESLRRGMEQAANGELEYLGDFSDEVREVVLAHLEQVGIRRVSDGQLFRHYLEYDGEAAPVYRIRKP